MPEVFLMVSYCGKHPHMSKDRLEKTRGRTGKEWIEHYGMLSAAADGCVQCVKHYHAEVRCTSEGNPASVWSGSFSDPRFNAWRSTFEDQSATTLEGQESVRAFLLTLEHAKEHIEATQQKWNKNKLLERYKELMDDAQGRQSSKQSPKKRCLGRNKINQPVSELVPQASRRVPFLERMDEQDASGSVFQGGRHREPQSEPQLQRTLDRPACSMCASFSCGNCYVIYLGPFWHDVAAPGLEGLASRIKGEVESINVCASCIVRFMRNCEMQMREIRQHLLPDASLQLLDKAHGNAAWTCVSDSERLLCFFVESVPEYISCGQVG